MNGIKILLKSKTREEGKFNLNSQLISGKIIKPGIIFDDTVEISNPNQNPEIQTQKRIIREKEVAEKRKIQKKLDRLVNGKFIIQDYGIKIILNCPSFGTDVTGTRLLILFNKNDKNLDNNKMISIEGSSIPKLSELNWYWIYKNIEPVHAYAGKNSKEYPLTFAEHPWAHIIGYKRSKRVKSVKIEINRTDLSVVRKTTVVPNTGRGFWADVKSARIYTSSKGKCKITNNYNKKKINELLNYISAYAQGEKFKIKERKEKSLNQRKF